MCCAHCAVHNVYIIHNFSQSACNLELGTLSRPAKLLNKSHHSSNPTSHSIITFCPDLLIDLLHFQNFRIFPNQLLCYYA